jgi:hypothetical protein
MFDNIKDDYKLILGLALIFFVFALVSIKSCINGDMAITKAKVDLVASGISPLDVACMYEPYILNCAARMEACGAPVEGVLDE